MEDLKLLFMLFLVVCTIASSFFVVYIAFKEHAKITIILIAITMCIWLGTKFY